MHESVASKIEHAEEPGRAGARALGLFARVLNARVIWAHAEGPLVSGELETRLGWAAKASLRVAIGNLSELGALARVESANGRRPAATELTPAGQDLLRVAEALERWFSHSPFGALELPDPAARGAVRALVAGWDSSVIGALAERPRSLSELSSDLAGHSYAGLKRRVAKMRGANLVDSEDEGRRSPRHGATRWLRKAVAPLCVASRWEHRYASGSLPPLMRREIEAILLLTLPLVDLPGEASGRCVLAAPATSARPGDDDPSLAAVSVTFERGELAAAVAGAEESPSTWALGTPDAWLDALVDGDTQALRIRGSEPALAGLIVEGLHRALFAGDSI